MSKDDVGKTTRTGTQCCFVKVFLFPLLVAFALWGVFFQELPLRMTRSIPFTAYHEGPIETSALVPGDHLQLLYHFWLTREKVAGRTPLLSNIYEFNVGDDAERREVDPGYVPFSLIYAAITEIGGSHALGWNLAQLGAVLTAFLFLYALARRYVHSRFMALAGATLAACVPYQWVNLGGGSPTGFGMAFLPALALGVDLAVRDGRVRGGLLAGVALLFCYTSDLHCLAFACMLIPAWALVAWFSRTDGLRVTQHQIRAVARGLWPLFVGGVVVVGIAKMLTSFYVGTDVAGGRTVAEVMRNSPSKRALFGFVINHVDLHFRVGFVLLGSVLFLGVCIGVWAWIRRREGTPSAACKTPRPFVVAGLLVAGVAVVLLLGMGFNAPFEGLPIRILRAVAPPYKMIRQPIKVLCVLPTLLAPLFALGFAAFRELFVSAGNSFARGRSLYRDLAQMGSRIVVVAFVVAGVVESARAFRLGLCGLPERNRVYEAVVADAEVKGLVPHILALPIWPGDSAWSSLYEYNTLLYGVRMVNGYAAVCTEAYLRDAYRAFESVTQGRLTDEQAAMLRWHGITTVMLYPHAFPEQVSPFPVGVTLQRLLANRHLTVLATGDQIAFSLRSEKATEHREQIKPPLFVSPARRWSVLDGSAAPIAAQHAKAFLRSPVAWTSDLKWMIRVKGDGAIEGSRIVSVPNADPEGALVTLTSDIRDFEAVGGGGDVRWLSAPVGDMPEGWAQIGIDVAAPPGTDVLDVLLVEGGLPLMRNAIELPTTSFFHGGQIIFDDGAVTGVHFRPGHDPADEILYGFHLPLDPGRWHVSLAGDFTEASAGALRVLVDGTEVARGRVGAGAPPIIFESSDWAPVTVRFSYAGSSDVLVNGVRFEREL